MNKSLKFLKRFSIFALISLLIFSCSPNISVNETASFSLTLIQSRSAVSTSFSFSTANYTYTLTATGSSGTSTDVFSNISYSELNQTFSISPGTYTLVLKAYLNSVEAMSGTITGVSIQGANNSLAFYLTISEGFASEASITLELPDSGVYSVKAGVASIPMADEDECDYISATELEIDDSTSPSTVTFTASTFYSGRTQFVIFYPKYYDNNN